MGIGKFFGKKKAVAEANLAKMMLDSPEHPTEDVSAAIDAERYRKLRAQYWDEDVVAIVPNPKKHVYIGSTCLSVHHLDEFVDKLPPPAEMKPNEKVQEELSRREAEHQFLVARLKRVAHLAGYPMPEGDNDFIAEVAGTILGGIARKLEEQNKEPSTTKKLMPIHGTHLFMPMEMLNEEWAKKNHAQSLNRLAERGGISPSEAWSIVNGQRFGFGNEKKKTLELLQVFPAQHPFHLYYARLEQLEKFLDYLHQTIDSHELPEVTLKEIHAEVRELVSCRPPRGKPEEAP